MNLLDLDVFLAADYSQIEIRLIAEQSQDPLLIKQFRSGLDIHAQVGTELTGKPFELIQHDREVRRTMKELHFGIVYGIKDLYGYLVARGVKITQARADRLLRRYFAKYRGVRRLIDRQIAFAEEYGYVENIFGFRRPITVESATGAYWANQALNTPIQGAAHFLLLTALSLIFDKPKTYNLLQSPLADVHDALLFSTKLRYLVEANRQLLHLMQTGVADRIFRIFGRRLSIPLVAETKAGFQYGCLVPGPPNPKEAFWTSEESFLQMWREKHKDWEQKHKVWQEKH